LISASDEATFGKFRLSEGFPRFFYTSN